MIKVQFLDDSVRLLSSIVYRIILVIFGIVIIFTSTNVFSYSHYLMLTVSYVSIVGLLYFRVHKISILRLFFDFAYIGIILYGKPMNDILSMSFLYLPIINSPNFSGRRRNISLYVVTLLFFLGLNGINDWWKIFVVISFFAIIGYLENIRSSISMLAEDIFETIDESYVKNLQLNKTHRVYREIIKKIQDSRFSDSFPIEGIYCLSLEDKKYRIVNTSKYVFNVNFVDFENVFNELEKNGIVKNANLLIDEKPIKNNICMKIEQDEISYLFAVVLSKRGLYIYVPFLINSVLRVALARVANILAIEWKVRKVKKEYFDKLNQNIEYFESAADTMHFLNNKFSPLKSYITMAERLDSMPPGKKRDSYEQNAKKTRERARRSLEIIVERAENLLEMKNDLLFRSLERYSIGKLFSLIRRTWQEHFDTDRFETYWPKSDHDREVLLNEDGIYLVLSNIIDNMTKHNDGQYGIKFENEQGQYVVEFYNNFKKENKEKLLKLASEFMSEETAEIEMRKRNGLVIMKKILKQMPIEFELKVENTIYVFSLSFKEA